MLGGAQRDLSASRRMLLRLTTCNS